LPTFAPAANCEPRANTNTHTSIRFPVQANSSRTFPAAFTAPRRNSNALRFPRNYEISLAFAGEYLRKYFPPRRGQTCFVWLTGKRAEQCADCITFETFQKHLVRELHGTPYEAAFDLLGMSQRPLLVTVEFHEPADKANQLLAALADRCFAAGYFRYLGLV